MEMMKSKMVVIDKPKVDQGFPSYLLPHIYFKYRHVFNNLELFWGTKDFSPYLNSLMFIDRKDRAGFEPAVISEMLELHTAHDKVFPRFVNVDIWSKAMVFGR